MISVFELDWDEDNRSYCEEKHGLTEEIADEVLCGEPEFFRNTPGLRASHVMIGPDERGTLWTIAILRVTTHRWRPITGYESEHDDIELYRLARGRKHR